MTEDDLPVPHADGLVILREEELSQCPGHVTAHPHEYRGIVHCVNDRMLRGVIAVRMRWKMHKGNEQGGIHYQGMHYEERE